MVTAPLAAVDSIADLKSGGEGIKGINNLIDCVQPVQWIEYALSGLQDVDEELAPFKPGRKVKIVIKPVYMPRGNAKQEILNTELLHQITNLLMTPVIG